MMVVSFQKFLSAEILRFCNLFSIIKPLKEYNYIFINILLKNLVLHMCQEIPVCFFSNMCFKRLSLRDYELFDG